MVRLWSALGVMMTLVAVSWASPALAVTVQLALQTETIEAEQTVTAVVSVTGYRDSARPPSLVVPEGLTVGFVTNRAGIESTGRNVTRTVQFIYEVTASQTGSYVLGPADVMVDGLSETTNAVTLIVTPRTLRDDGPPVAAFAAFVDDTVYEGEVVLFHYGIRSRLRIYRDSWVRPQMPLLQSPRDGLPRSIEYVLDDPTGAIVVKETWQPMLATAPGELESVPSTVSVSVESSSNGNDRWRMRRTENVTLVTDPASISVLPLPPAPPGFAGLVGDFRISGSLDRTRVRAGDSVTYTVDVQGDGSLEGFALPEVPSVDGARFYDNDVGADAVVRDGAYVSQGRYQRVVVATRQGTLQVPSIDIVSFSPSERRYITHTLTFEPIRVRPGDEGSAAVESFSDADSDGIADIPADDDIRAIYRSGATSAGSSGPWLVGLAVLLGLPALLAFGHAGAAQVSAWRARQPEAPVSPLAPLSAAPVGSPARLGALDAVLRDVLERATGRPDASNLHSAHPGLAGRVDDVFSELGRVRFAGSAPSADLDARAVAVIDDVLATGEPA